MREESPQHSPQEITESARNLIHRSEDDENALKEEECPKEWWKTGVMALYALISMFCLTVTMTVVHDKVPEQTADSHLEDIAWNITSKWPTGIKPCLKATEIIALSLIYLTLLHALLHKDRSVILRRFLFHIGTVYGYRILTTSVTILPVPKLPLDSCMPKTDDLRKLFYLAR